jgi:DNA-binding NtrC family response regulator
MKQKILAVDDEPHMLKLMERIIKEKTPYGIKTTHSSLEIPEILEREEFDLIITDLKMPGMDGLDILRHIIEKNRREEVVIITAFGSLESAIEALSLGVFDYITKPFKKEQIIFAVNRVMRWQKMKREVAEISGIFETEPYEQAQNVFKAAYAKRLSERTGGDGTSMAERSGLPPQEIAALLNDAE